MQSRRPQGLTPLAIVLPHPPLPRRRSSLLSMNSAASPHTPRSCHSPALPIYYPANRKSTDSWNSSNGPDDMDFDWKPEQVLLLSRTLDALPAHLVTPFNGPVPPSNLLDKIARGVSQAKGPADWPHSIRATRVKLLELARIRAKEEALAAQRRHVIKEEVEIDDGSHYSYLQDGEDKPLEGIASRRPLYRQSSMDFIKPTPAEIKDNANIARLSSRLQRSDRMFPNPAYHPYSRTPRVPINRRSSSPPLPADVPSLINPSTPSSSTLNTLSTFSSQPRALRRSASTLSTASTSLFSDSSSGMPLPDPRLQRVKRSDSFCTPAPVPPPKDTPTTAGMKRLPSYGTLAQEAKKAHDATGQTHARKLSGSYPSSDEEEKVRTRHAKKMRTKTGAVTPTMSPSAGSAPPSSAPPMPSACTTAPSSPVVMKGPVPPPKDKVPKPRLKGVACTDGNVKSPKPPVSSDKAVNQADSGKSGKVKDKNVRPTAMNLQRNPSMFGAELPHLRKATPSPPPVVNSPPPALIRRGLVTTSEARSPSPMVSALPPSAGLTAPQSPQSPISPKVRTLRRVRRLAPARRISFGSLAAPGDEADADGEGENEPLAKRSCLGSAFQLL